MDYQLPRICFNHSATLTKCSPLSLKSFITGLCILLTSFQLAQTAICSSSAPNSAAITTDQYSFNGYTAVRTYKVVAGPISNSLYYMSRIVSSSNNAEIRRMNASGSLIWVTSYPFYPIVKSLSIDSGEQSIYFANNISPLVVLCLSANNGSLVSQQSFTGITGQIYDTKTWPQVDNSGYFFIGYDNLSKAKVCKYTFSSSTAACQSITNMNFGYGHLMFSSSQFFVLGAGTGSALQMYKFTFSNTLVDWANKISCSSGSCSAFLSESILSADGSTIYSFFLYGQNPFYAYFTGLSASNGGVTTSRYKSTGLVINLWGLALSGDYAVAIIDDPTAVYLIIYNFASSAFTYKTFTGNLYGLGVEPSSNRFIVIGYKPSNGYTTKLSIQSIDNHPDLSPISGFMNPLASGVDQIVAEAGMTIGTVNNSTLVSAGVYQVQTVTYNQQSSYSFSTYLQTNTQALSLTENNNSTLTPDLPCSPAGVTQISYSMISCNGANFPSFVSLNSASGILSIEAPSVSSSTDYGFCVDSSITGMTNAIRYAIKLTIKKCTPSNCQRCLATDSSVCIICNSGYNLNSGACNLPESDNGKLLRIICQVCMGLITLLSIASSLMNISSLASLWSMIYQIQLFFLLFLTGAFIPKDIENIITGLKVCMNPFIYFHFTGNRYTNYVYEYFDFGLGNSNLEKLGIESDSTFINIYSVIVSILIICVSHFFIMLCHKLLKKESKSECCNYVLSMMHWILNKLMIFLTFAIYIRNFLNINQFVLVSSISEIYIFNHLDINRIISIVIAILALIGCIAIILFTFYLVLTQAINKDQESPDNRSKFSELFIGVSKNKKSRLYVVFVQLRRTIFVILLVTVEPVSSILVISILVGLQLIYLGVLIFIRPFELVKCNIVEITNEIYFLTMLASLFRYNSVTNWERTPTTIYTWFIASNCFLGLLIVLGK